MGFGVGIEGRNASFRPEMGATLVGCEGKVMRTRVKRPHHFDQASSSTGTLAMTASTISLPVLSEREFEVPLANVGNGNIGCCYRISSDA
jgi:hypothetical protein